MERKLVVAITGASGAPYAIRFLQVAIQHYSEIYVALSEQASTHRISPQNPSSV
ncbi:MAG: hypothetical protein NT023_01510 [Armatimonadetes bacterium]|nr:hypothetical protein [Armatimonadota bacterium]